MINHTFAICAYKESPYLEYCMKSLMGQSVPSRVILCTSTPNDRISYLAEKYKIPVYIRQGESDIQEDWNFAYEKADTEYVTIAHQDDIYHRNYAEVMKKYLEKYPDTLIAMTDYKIINRENQVRGEVSLLVKQLLKLPLRVPCLADKKSVKLGVQSLGNAICCPSVCYHKSLLGNSVFHSSFKYTLDWEAFCEIGSRPGRFTYIPRCLFYYRIHEGAATKECLRNHQKEQEEQAMFERFWPRWMAELLMKPYKLSYKSYEK